MIYLDNAATTRMSPTAAEGMYPYFSELYGNPSSLYQIARRSKEAVRKSREVIGGMLGAVPDEILFTSGGTESDNWALAAVFEALRERGKHMITSRIEHPAVLRTCEYLERERGARITYLEPDRYGVIHPEQAEAAICQDTILLSVMAANNEIGTIQPIAQLGALARSHGILFHTDAVQAFGHIPLDVREMQIDLLSASGHKFNGPKGCGFLYVRKGTGIGAMIRGGAQEFNRRAGTENVPGIVGTGIAAREAQESMEQRAQYEAALRDELIQMILETIPETELNGHPTSRLPNNVNITFKGIRAESILIMLDLAGICASGGSACASGSLDPSHVLLAAGRTREDAFSSVRFTLSHETTHSEIERTVEVLQNITGKLRER